MKLEFLACVQTEAGVLSDGDKIHDKGDIVEIKNQKLIEELLEKKLAKEYVEPKKPPPPPKPKAPPPPKPEKLGVEPKPPAKDDLTKIKGIDSRTAVFLNKTGINTIKALAECKPDKISAIAGIGGKKGANKIVEEAKKALK